MKKNFLTTIMCGAILTSGISQNLNLPSPGSAAYNKMKLDGNIPGNAVINQTYSFTPTLDDLKKFSLNGTANKPGPSGCGCYIQPDATYTLAMAPNDDGSTGLLNIPFTFCLYGVTYTNLYINNNGNISFGSPFSTFSSNPFPTSGFTMVAPFWGDVDTRGAGTVKYKITPTAMFINWEGVGYFSSATDKLNTFQLIITDGTDPILPAGNNIAFCYGDMQWTTGSASGGVGGFGGTPSTVGANKGDGISFIQLGRFDQPGAAYDGPFGANDGVSWLDNQSFFFNVCSSTNIPPIANFIPAISGTGGGCDSISVCGTNDTLLINALFLSPENNQTTTININFNGATGFTVLNNTPGNPATATIQVISSVANAGLNTITFTATDNGTPVGTTIVNYNVFVDTTGLANFNPTINGVLGICNGASTVLTVNPTNFNAYTWNTGSTDTSITVNTAGQYWVTSELNGCSKTVSVNVEEHNPTPVILGPMFVCSSNPTTLFVDSAIYVSYMWSNGGGTNDSASVPTGTYTVTVVDSFGCTATSPPVSVMNFNPSVSIAGNTTICSGTSTTLSATATIPSGASFLWSNGGTNSTTVVNASDTVIVTVNYNNGCAASDTVIVSVINPVTSSQTPNICQGENFMLPSGQFVSVAGQYLDTLIAATGCDSIVTTNLTVTPLADATINAVNDFCDNALPTTLTAINSGGIWNGNGITNPSTGEFTPTQAGIGQHQIIYTIGGNCGNADTIMITVNSSPDFLLLAIEDTCFSARGTILTSIISGTPPYNYLWSRGDISQNLGTVLTGIYSLTVTDSNNCSTILSIEVGNIINVCNVIIPNIITPNGDGMNDNFVIENIEFFPDNKVAIFNRWGKKVFEKNGYKNDWDGEDYNDGTYFYIVELNDKENTVHKGTLTILR